MEWRLGRLERHDRNHSGQPKDGTERDGRNEEGNVEVFVAVKEVLDRVLENQKNYPICNGAACVERSQKPRNSFDSGRAIFAISAGGVGKSEQGERGEYRSDWRSEVLERFESARF